jgi:DbpA RNA binding domain
VTDEGPPRPAKRRSTQPMATYRLRVGRRHKVQPGSIVGAIANEGGLSRGDFGHIDIRGDHTLVELPADLSDLVFERLRHTRVSGQLIELRRDDGGPSGDGGPSYEDGPSSDGGPSYQDGQPSPRAKRLAKPAGRSERGAKPRKFAAKPEHAAKPEKFAAKPEKKRHRKGPSAPR